MCELSLWYIFGNKEHNCLMSEKSMPVSVLYDTYDNIPNLWAARLQRECEHIT